MKKWIKNFKKFNEDRTWGDEDDSTTFASTDGKNPVTRQDATKYVEDKLRSNEYTQIFHAVGMEPPKANSTTEIIQNGAEFDEMFDKAREKAIEYFSHHPEEMEQEVDYRSYRVNGGDGIPRTNNIGGTSHAASTHIGESMSFDTDINIDEDEMGLFSKEEPLQDLIRNQKIALKNKKVSFNKSDNETINTLDIYLDIDKSLKSNDEE